MIYVLRYIELLNNKINGVVWGMPMLLLIVGTGIILTIITKCFQIKYARHISRKTLFNLLAKNVRKNDIKEKSISQFQAMCTALAAALGTGNITGVATAIVIGGPGAVFWMWVSAVIGMMTIYAENVLGIYYRKKDKNGEWSGGAMYYLENGLSRKKGLKTVGKILAVLFSAFCIFASFGMGNMAQINSISSALESTFGIRPVICGTVLAIIAAFVILGGIKRIGNITEKFVPLMAVFYIVASLIICILNYKELPYVVKSIFVNAFSFKAIGGGGSALAIKKAIEMGFKRGVFSNEAGLGSSVSVHASSNVKEPALQGMWGIFEVFLDTIVVCTLTAFVLLSTTCSVTPFNDAINSNKSIEYISIADDDKKTIPLISTKANTLSNHTGNNSYIYTNIAQITKNERETKFSLIDGVPLVTYAFSQRFGKWAGKLLAIAILLFGFATIIGWSFYGLKAWEYLFGKKSAALYKTVYVLFVVIGSVLKLELVWNISDTFNALMAIPNLIGVLILSKDVKRITDNYIRRNILNINETPLYSAYE